MSPARIFGACAVTVLVVAVFPLTVVMMLPAVVVKVLIANAAQAGTILEAAWRKPRKLTPQLARRRAAAASVLRNIDGRPSSRIQ